MICRQKGCPVQRGGLFGVEGDKGIHDISGASLEEGSSG